MKVKNRNIGGGWGLSVKVLKYLEDERMVFGSDVVFVLFVWAFPDIVLSWEFSS
jgi:hypothetical protein